MCMLHIYRYVEVDEDNGVHLFYYFVRSEREDSPGDDPVVLWLTGGPGCSVLTGLAYEIGMYGCMLCYCHQSCRVPAQF
jgi:carboxypeptidase C (cathepsin A)